MYNVSNDFLVTLVCASPIYLVLIYGVIVAYRRREIHIRVSRYAMIGLGILAISKLLNSLFLQQAVEVQNGEHRPSFDLVIGVISQIFVLVDMVGWVFVLRAIFADKAKRKNDADETSPADKEPSP